MVGRPVEATAVHGVRSAAAQRAGEAGQGTALAVLGAMTVIPPHCLAAVRLMPPPARGRPRVGAGARRQGS